MTQKLAFVLEGGGSHGALQVGALRAALEAGFRPDFLVGTSIGAVNSAFIALHGFNHCALNLLETAWKEAARSDFLPAGLLRLSVNALMERTSSANQQRIQRFFAHYGLTPDLKFGSLTNPPLFTVATDLNSAEVVIYGKQPEDSVMEAVLASCSLPPWLSPQLEDGRFLVDGGFLSNLPVEPALRLGASAVLAFSLGRAFFGAITRPFLTRSIQAVVARQRELELLLAEARGVPVNRIELIPEGDHPLWDFAHTQDWIQRGYALATEQLAGLSSPEFAKPAREFTTSIR